MGLGVAVVTRGWAALFGLFALAIPLLLAQWLLWPVPDDADVARKRRRGIGGLIMGRDGRTSTSKVQVVLWTAAILFAFTFLLVWGRNHDCGASTTGKCAQATVGRDAFDRAVDTTLQPEYYVLMGFPLTAAIAAKALTSRKVEDGELVKPELEAPTGLAGGIREVVSNDEGETDLLDFQYFAFNLLTLAFFLIEFLTHPAKGLPDLPPTLVALSGAAAAAYTAKKALESTPASADPDAAPEALAAGAAAGAGVIE
jgi:hypothetical protein